MQIFERLRLAREAHGLDIPALAQKTRLRPHLLEAVEEGRWSDLPRGVYARAVVRAYAEAVGIEPNRVVTEVASLLPEAEDPLDGIARVHGWDRPANDRRATPSAPAEPAIEAAPPRHRAVRFMEIEPGWGLDLGPRFRDAAVSAIDGAVLAGFTLLMAIATAAIGGVSLDTLGEVAAPAILAQAILAGVCYFVLLGGIGGATLGARLVDGTPRGPVFRGDLAAALREAGRLALRESSIIVALTVPWPAAHPDREGDRPAAHRSRTPLAERAAAQ